jgi:PPOX class probable FMN-dependent enzyme
MRPRRRQDVNVTIPAQGRAAPLETIIAQAQAVAAAVADRPAAPPSPLSPREREVAVLVARAFLARCPFLLIGTADATGNCDVSPRGDAPGFVTPLDDTTLLIPERPGNRRADTLSNILDNPHVGLLCLIPGVDETLRVNGRAALVRDAALLERAVVHGNRPVLAIAVEVEECFLHCGRSFKRTHLWDTASWLRRADLPSLAQMLMDQVQPRDVTLEELENDVEEAYTHLY